MLKDKKTRKLFITVFVVTVVAVLVVAGGSLIVLRSLVQPPTVPTHAAQPFIPNVPVNPIPSEPDEPAFKIVEPHPDDALINVNSPFDLLSDDDEWERKPDFYTFLVFGYDDGLNTDTIMITAFDAAERQAYIVSIPRDTQVDVSRNVRRINSAYPVGRLHGRGHEGGVDQLKREVQTLIGFRPDFYVSIEEDAFIRLVDAVGGVNVNVPFHMRYDDPWQNLHINIPTGPQRLDGENALHFVRFRMSNDSGRAITDFQRMEHQQQLIAAMMQELLQPSIVTQIPELIRTYLDHVDTDLTLFQLLWFAEQFVLGDVVLNAYNYPTTSIRTSRWYEIPIADEVLELINRTINPFTRDITMDNLQLAS